LHPLPFTSPKPQWLSKLFDTLLLGLFGLLINCEEALLTDGIKGLLGKFQEYSGVPFDQRGMSNFTLWGNVNFSVLALESTTSWITSFLGMYRMGGLLLPAFLSHS
jgi:hypothetical protein